MGEGARTARLTALLAGNGFAFIKIVGYGERAGPPPESFWGLVTLTVISFVGMGAAYVALGSDARWPERTSIGAIVVLLSIWVGGMYRIHGG
jgi:hypothetical protein